MGILNLRTFRLLAFFCCLLPALSYGAQWASVKSNKAIIYSDKEMSSPIGYITKGKKVRVGDKARNNGRVLAVIVSGKVAYIKISDIQTSDSIGALQTASERIKNKIDKPSFEKKLSIFSHIGLYTDFDDASETFGLFSFGARGYYTEVEKKTTYRVGIDSTKITSEDIEFDLVLIPIDYSKLFMRSKRLDFNLYGGAILIPSAAFRVASLFTIRGYGLGLNVGTEFIYKLTKKTFLHLDFNSYYLYMTGFNLPSNNIYTGTLDPRIYGLRSGLSLSYSY